MLVRTLLAVAAVVSAVAAPSPDSPDAGSNTPRNGAMRLPISKREMRLDQTDPRTTFERLIDERLRMRVKYSKYLDAAGQAKLDRELEDRRHHLADVQRRATPVTFTGWGFDFCYTVPLSIGTPPQTFEMMMDTGSTHMWLLDECTNAEECGRIPLYKPDQSSTYEATQTPFRVKYVLGETSGMWGYDTVSIGEYSVRRQGLGVVDHATEWLSAGTNRTGLVGFGFVSLRSGANVMPFWETLAPTWPEPVFSVYLQRATNAGDTNETSSFGSLMLGGIDSSLYQGEINYIRNPKVTPDDWVVILEGMSVGGRDIRTNFTVRVDGQTAVARPYAAIDTGTTYLLGPLETVAAIHQNIAGAIEINKGLYIFPCDKDPEIGLSFTFGGQTYDVEDTDLIIGMLNSSVLAELGVRAADNNEVWCLSGIMGAEVGTAGVPWIVGAAFLKNVYTVFRYDPPAIGFARLSDSATKVLNNETIPGNPTGGVPGPEMSDGSSPFASPTADSTAASAANRHSAQYHPVVFAVVAMVALLV